MQYFITRRKILNIPLYGYLIFSLFSCNVSPCCRVEPIVFPEMAIEKEMDEALSYPDSFSSFESIPPDWWTLYNDPQLSELINVALEQNPTLQAAQEKIIAAQYEADKVRSALYPNIIWTGDVKRYKLSQTSIIPDTNSMILPGVGPGIPFYFTQYESALNFYYDFDVWGKKCQALQAAIGVVGARIADEAFARLCLSISIAQTYFRLQVAYERHQIALDYVKNRETYYTLTQQRVKSNLDDDLTLNTIQSQISNAKQELFQIEADIAVNEHQLKAYLANDFNEHFDHVHITRKPVPKAPLPLEIPLNLLSHRPDIATQLWLIESLGHQINVARAGFYPDFNLMAVAGFQTIHLSQFFEWASVYGNVGPAFSLPIYDGGFLKANLRKSEVDYELAILDYNKLVLNAVKEVLDALSNIRYANQQLQEFKQETSNQNDISALVAEREKRHIGSDLDVLNSQQSLLVAKNREALAQEKSILTILSLIKALGGGYSISEECFEEEIQ